MRLIQVANPKTRMKVLRARLKMWLIYIAGFGPVTYFIVDRVGHLVGICIGGH